MVCEWLQKDFVSGILVFHHVCAFKMYRRNQDEKSRWFRCPLGSNTFFSSSSSVETDDLFSANEHLVMGTEMIVSCLPCFMVIWCLTQNWISLKDASLSSLWSSLGLQAETFRIFDIFDEYQVTPKEFFFSFYSDLNLSKKDLSLLFETFLNSKQLIVLSNLCSEIKKLTITINNHTDKI